MIRACDGSDPNLHDQDGQPCVCGLVFDDVRRLTVWPHAWVPSVEQRAEWAAALESVDRFLVRVVFDAGFAAGREAAAESIQAEGTRWARRVYGDSAWNTAVRYARRDRTERPASPPGPAYDAGSEPHTRPGG